MIRSTKTVCSLKTLCTLLILCHKLSFKCFNTQNIRKNEDHTYDKCVTLGQNSITTSQENSENIALMDSLDKMLVNNKNQINIYDTDIVIDSMNADIPLCAEDTDVNIYILNPDDLQGVVIPNTSPPHIDPTTLTKTDSSNLCNSSLDSSFDGTEKLKYDPTGTQLILPLKKRKPVVIDPEQTVLEIWRKDALSHNWTVPILRLSNSDIYDLSQKPPYWSEMDPYSGLEEENKEMSITPDKCQTDTLPRINEQTPSASSSGNDIIPPTMIGNRYQLQERKPCTSMPKTRTSDRSRSKSVVNYTDFSDDDSDYEPKPKRIRNPNVGLREPFSQ